jgi:hypothetical protein
MLSDGIIHSASGGLHTSAGLCVWAPCADYVDRIAEGLVLWSYTGIHHSECTCQGRTSFNFDMVFKPNVPYGPMCVCLRSILLLAGLPWLGCVCEWAHCADHVDRVAELRDWYSGHILVFWSYTGIHHSKCTCQGRTEPPSISNIQKTKCPMRSRVVAIFTDIAVLHQLWFVSSWSSHIITL